MEQSEFQDFGDVKRGEFQGVKREDESDERREMVEKEKNVGEAFGEWREVDGKAGEGETENEKG